MDIWEPDKIILFLTLFMPGFISIKVYGLIVASKPRDFTSSVLEAIGYSVLNFAVLSWLIFLITSHNFEELNPTLYSLCIILIFFIFPIIWPLLFIWISKFNLFKRYILSPINMPWDDVFNRRKSYWVIIHLKDGRMVGGKYGKLSRASAYPNQRQIFLENLWELDEKNAFSKKVERSRGAIFFEDDISIIEFFE